MKVNMTVNTKGNKVNIYDHGLRKRAKASVKSGGIMTSGRAGPEKSTTQYGFLRFAEVS